MITVWFWNLTDSLKFALFSAVPTIETPAWIVQNFPNILKKIVAFNYYLPVIDTMMVVTALITITLVWKIAKVLLSVFVDLGA